MHSDKPGAPLRYSLLKLEDTASQSRKTFVPTAGNLTILLLRPYDDFTRQRRYLGSRGDIVGMRVETTPDELF